MKRIIYIITLVFAISMSGCSDWLDILPKNEQVTADYWKTKEDVESVLASGYYYMRTATPSLIAWGELRASSIYSYRSLEENKLQDFQLTAGSSLSQWTSLYRVINMANSVIYYAPEVQKIDDTYTEAAMKSHQTEAYFMRALMYFYLVRNFKEVPMALDPYVDDSAPYNIAKSDENAIMEQIKSDIRTALATEAAKEFFDHEKWAGASKGRATKWALYALMADVCLWTEEYDECIKYADLLINATSSKRPAFMSIPEQWFSIFNPGNSNESIFELNWDQTTYGQTSNSPANYFAVSESPNYQYSLAMIERLYNDYLEVLPEKESIRSQFGAYVAYGDEDAETKTYCIWKYRGTEIKDITATRVTADANFIIYRMADVMLMKAEALIWKGGAAAWAEAINIMNTIRERANLQSLEINLEEVDELAMLEYLLHERDMELAAECKRWYDLLRFGKTQNYKYKQQFVEMIVENNSSANDSWIRSVLKNNYAWYLPINEKEIEVNGLLVQNPYYAPTN